MTIWLIKASLALPVCVRSDAAASVVADPPWFTRARLVFPDCVKVWFGNVVAGWVDAVCAETVEAAAISANAEAEARISFFIVIAPLFSQTEYLTVGVVRRNNPAKSIV